MKEGFWKRTISLVLTLALLAGVFPTVTAQAGEIVGGNFNPTDKDLQIEFSFDTTQRANVEVFVDGESRGYLMHEHEIKGTKREMTSYETCQNGSYYTAPYTPNDYILSNVSVSEIEGDDGPHILLDWDGRIDGIPVIGDDPTRDECVLEIRISGVGYPERNRDCQDIYDDDGNLVDHIAGENWTWTQNPDWAISVAIYIDYKAILEGAASKDSFLMVKGGTSYKISCEMDEIFCGNSALKTAFKAYMETNSIAAVEVGDPVNMIDGSYTFSYTDLRLEGAIPLTFLRTYNSRDKDGSLGQGFTHSYDYSLFDDDGIIRVTLPYGEEVRFLRRANNTYHTLQNQGYTLENSGSGYVMNHEYGAKFYFSADGKLTSVLNLAGVTVASMTYSGNELSRIDGVAGSFNLTWSNGHIVKVSDSAGRSVTYGYDGDNLTSVTNPDGDSLRYSYDANGYIAAASDFEGVEYVRNTYDEKGRVTEQVFVNADMETAATFSYDAAGNLLKETDAAGNSHTYTYASSAT